MTEVIHALLARLLMPIILALARFVLNLNVFDPFLFDPVFCRPCFVGSPGFWFVFYFFRPRVVFARVFVRPVVCSPLFCFARLEFAIFVLEGLQLSEWRALKRSFRANTRKTNFQSLNHWIMCSEIFVFYDFHQTHRFQAVRF